MEGQILQLPSIEPTPEETTVSREQREQIWQFLRGLSTRQQEVFVLRYVEGWSGKEVAEVLLLLKGAGLTSEQKQQVRNIFVNHRESLETCFRDLPVANAVLTKTLFAAEEIGRADITPYAERVTRVWRQLFQEGLMVILEVRQILTREQRAKAARLREQLHTLQGALGAFPQGQGEKTTR
jgi:Spy/CpxP family protein refolding chaperone